MFGSVASPRGRVSVKVWFCYLIAAFGPKHLTANYDCAREGEPLAGLTAPLQKHHFGLL